MTSPQPSVYLSSRFERRAELSAYSDDLARLGVEVTSRWVAAPTDPNGLTDDAWRELARKDVEDIRRADALVLFTEPGRAGAGGRHVEFGVALGLGKRLLVVGGVENLFHRLENVQVVPDWQEALAAVASWPAS